MDQDDRSDNIINLARGMIERNDLGQNSGYSLKTVALAALLSATAAGGLTASLVERARPLNHYEKTEIKALIAYAASQSREPAAMLQDELFSRFEVHSFDEFASGQMKEIRRYLRRYIYPPT
jgi:hypothetical protein